MNDQAFGDLVGRAKRGDEAAIQELLDHFEADVRLMVRVRLPRALRSQFDSMDFVQAIWTSFFRDAAAEDQSRFENSGHFRAYLAGVARNKVLAEYRRRTKTHKYDLSREEPLYIRRGDRDQPLELPGHDPSPSKYAQADEAWLRLVQGRTEVEVRVVALRREGQTFEQIAQETGIGERTARRIIQELRERLEAEERRWH